MLQILINVFYLFLVLMMIATLVAISIKLRRYSQDISRKHSIVIANYNNFIILETSLTHAEAYARINHHRGEHIGSKVFIVREQPGYFFEKRDE